MPTASNQSRPDDLSALNERLENIENTLRLILLHLVMDEAGRSMSDLNDPTGDTTVVKNEKVRPVAVREKHASRTKAKVSSSVKSRRKVATSSSTGRTSGGKTSKERVGFEEPIISVIRISAPPSVFFIYFSTVYDDMQGILYLLRENKYAHSVL